jgi:hypothetical protein
VKTLEFGKPIELTEAQGRLTDLISRSEWGRIAPDVLRSLGPDVRRLRRFLDQNALSDTDEAKVVLKQFGISQAQRTATSKAAAAGKVFSSKAFKSPKDWYSKRAAETAKKAIGKTKRRKGKKGISSPTTNRPVKA